MEVLFYTKEKGFFIWTFFEGGSDMKESKQIVTPRQPTPQALST